MPALWNTLPFKVCCCVSDVDPEFCGHLFQGASCLVRSDELGNWITAQTDLCLFRAFSCDN